MTDRKLQQLLRVWQQRLRLQDWDINVTQVPLGTWSSSKQWGDCGIGSTKHFADIQILQEQFHTSETDSMELILVHELLHVVFPSCRLGIGDGVENTLYEEGVDRAAKALVAAYND